MTKEEYGDFVLRYKGCGACFPMYCNLNYFEKRWFSAIQKDVAELEAQIEKMKCCYNCANDTLEPPEVIGNGICQHCKNHSKWELED